MPRRPQPTDLLLDRQLCFPLYAASRLMTRLYQPLLAPLQLTYPQYLVLLVLWEESPATVTRIGERTLLASSTLTPLLKRLEALGYVKRQRSHEDERVVLVELTATGRTLRDRCECIPSQLFERVGWSVEEATGLKRKLDKLVGDLAAVAGVEE